MFSSLYVFKIINSRNVILISACHGKKELKKIVLPNISLIALIMIVITV